VEVMFAGSAFWGGLTPTCHIIRASIGRRNWCRWC